MVEKLKHWYDGWFYDVFISPNQDKAFENVKKIIPEGSTVIDAGCGTGRLCFQLQSKCKKIDGIDASEKNILSAKKNLNVNFHNNINFYHSDINSFLEHSKEKYDFAILSYVIHEIREQKREVILNLLSLYADKIIIVDYLSPQPKNFLGFLNRLVEFFAGRNHFRNFKTYIKNNGLNGLALKTGLIITNEIKDNPKTSHITVLSKF